MKRHVVVFFDREGTICYSRFWTLAGAVLFVTEFEHAYVMTNPQRWSGPLRQTLRKHAVKW